MKGFDVVTCPWRNPSAAVLQVGDMIRFRDSSTPQMAKRFCGVVQTVWSGSAQFIDAFYGKREEKGENTPVRCFKAMYDEIVRLAQK
jgi:hypothetical protein